MSGRTSLAAALSLLGAVACEKPTADASLVSYIASIKAVDNHAHPMRPVGAGAPADTDFDALPLDALPPFTVPFRLRAENPEWAAAAAALYGVPPTDTGAAHQAKMKAARGRIVEAKGDKFPEWALDEAGIEVMLANRISLGAGLGPPRFRWVPFADALMLPLDTRNEASRTPDTRSLYPKEAALLHRYMRDLGVATLPPTLDEYVKKVVAPTLASQKKGGAVAVKFEAAYLRPLDFADPDPATARRVYARYAAAGTPTHAEYKGLQDYLFREIAREAGRLGMAVHIHSTEVAGGFYGAGGSSPSLLEPAFNDSTLRATNFVIIHGGWPLVEQTMTMVGKPNVYADVSMMALIAEPSRFAATLRLWLGEWPEKILFGTDAFDGGAEQGWEQVAHVAASTTRRALAVALTGMMRDGEITRERAEQIARMVLRENAVALYHLGPTQAR